MLIYKDSPFFDVKAAKQIYEQNKILLQDREGFETVLKNTLFFNVYNDARFVGIVFVFEEDGKNWIGGAARRKCHKACLNALKEVAGMFDKVYAKTPHKTAVFCLKRAGFKFIHKKKDMMVFKFKNERKER